MVLQLQLQLQLHQGWFAVVLIVGYILIANILLLNLLIAMMSSTYEEVSNKSMQLWAVQNIELLEESRTLGWWTGPLQILYNIYLAASFVVQYISSCRRLHNGSVSPAAAAVQIVRENRDQSWEISDFIETNAQW